jgi:hypothetical protein
MTSGKTGCYRKTVPLSEEVVAACSIDPLNPAHTVVFGQLIQEFPGQKHINNHTHRLLINY